jgi:hypothetical protein
MSLHHSSNLKLFPNMKYSQISSNAIWLTFAFCCAEVVAIYQQRAIAV